MTDERLFDYEEVRPRRRRSSPVPPKFVPKQGVHGLIVNRHGISGFHMVRMVDEYASAHAECGFVGHLIDTSEQHITQVPECAKCVLAFVIRTTTAQEKRAKRKK